MRFVVVGCGYISRVHLAAISRIAGAGAMALVGRDGKKVAERAGEFSVPYTYTDWNEAFRSDGIDAALICLPHKLHYRCCLDALHAGKHVLIEKPISITPEQAAEMTALAESKGLTLMVAHMKRFDRRFIAMKQKIDAGGIGDVFLAKSEWIGPREVFELFPWVRAADQGGGPLMGFGSHHIDLLQWMVGPIKTISCKTNNRVWPEIEVEDTAVAVIEFENCAVGSLIYTWGAAIHGQYESLAIYGTRGALLLNGEMLSYVSESEYGDRTPRLLDTSRAERKEIEEFGKELAITSLEPFVKEIEHFIECVTSGKRPMIDGHEAGKTVAVISKAYQSAGIKK